MNQLTIKNCTVVNEGNLSEKDVLVMDGRIEKMEASIEVEGDFIDAKGLYLLPGFIDDQVHFREPGLTERGNIQSESIAAVVGGTTSFMDMPNVIPPTLNLELWNQKNKIAEQGSIANYSFYMGSSNTNIEDIKNIDANQVCGLKVFMGSSTGNLLVDDQKALESIFHYSPVLITTHCEDTPLITENEKKAYEKYGDDIPIELHEEIRSRDACLISTKKAIKLAQQFNAKLHVLHISTKDEIELFKAGPVEEKKITAEVCVPHLLFSSKDYQNLGTLIKCNPSIKSNSDKKALRQALKDGTIDYVATDHAPHVLREKQNTYLSAPSGMPSVQHSLLAVLEMVHEGDIKITDVPKITSHNVAKRFDIKDRGFIREGFWADLVLVNMNDTYEVKKEKIFYKCGWSPFESYTFKSRIIETIVNGERVYSQGKILSDKRGKKLEFTRG
tara:strand:- start:1116 stop:2447 length:1332 start_codon:yes stop_codon:yes gene_type:complete